MYLNIPIRSYNIKKQIHSSEGPNDVTHFFVSTNESTQHGL